MKRKIILGVWLLAGLMIVASRAADQLTEPLQKGLIEEEVNHNLEAAAGAYRTAVTLYDAQHATAATAVFRLGEVLRKQGKTNEASVQYRRILSEFADQAQLTQISRQYLGETEAVAPGGSGAERASYLRWEQERADTQAEYDLINARVAELKKLSRKDLRQTLPGMIADARLNDLLVKLNDAEQLFSKLKTNLGDANPEVSQQARMITTIESQIETAVDGIMLGLETQAKIVAARLETIKKRLMEASANGIGQPVSTADGMAPATKEEAEELSRLQAMIKNSPDIISVPNEKGRLPLQIAAANGWLSVARFLLDHGANPDANKYDLPTALHYAAGRGHKAMVELLLSRGATVNKTISGEVTPLHLACLNGNRNVIEVLLKNKASVLSQITHAISREDEFVSGHFPMPTTPVEIAIKARDLPLTELLLSAGANGNSGWKQAIQQDDVNFVRLLLKYRADREWPMVAWQGENQVTPLILAIGCHSTNLVMSLIEEGANANATTSRKKTPLIYLTESSEFSPDEKLFFADQLLKAGAKPDMADETGMTAAHYACTQNATRLLRQLINAKADINLQNNLGATPLSMALLYHNQTNKEIVPLLLDHGAAVNIVWPKPVIPENNERTQASPDLKLSDQQWTPLLAALDMRDISAIDLLLSHGADVNQTNSMGWAPLHAAFVTPDTNIFKMILAYKPDVNLHGSFPRFVVHSASCTIVGTGGTTVGLPDIRRFRPSEMSAYSPGSSSLHLDTNRLLKNPPI